jgi:hypothetical protein
VIDVVVVPKAAKRTGAGSRHKISLIGSWLRSRSRRGPWPCSSRRGRRGHEIERLSHVPCAGFRHHRSVDERGLGGFLALPCSWRYPPRAMGGLSRTRRADSPGFRAGEGVGRSSFSRAPSTLRSVHWLPAVAVDIGNLVPAYIDAFVRLQPTPQYGHTLSTCQVATRGTMGLTGLLTVAPVGVRPAMHFAARDAGAGSPIGASRMSEGDLALSPLPER